MSEEMITENGGMTRREFMIRTAAALATVGVATQMTALGAQPVYAAENTDVECDVVIVGSGFAGLVAAVRARELGARVILVEKKSSFKDTNSYNAGGAVFAGDTFVQRKANAGYTKEAFFNDLRKYEPWGDIAQQRVYADNIGPIVDWMGNFGIPFPQRATPIGLQHMIVPKTVTDLLFKKATADGVQFRYETKAVRLIQDNRGRVLGLTVMDANKTYDIKAKSVILAAGGFQGNNDLITRYIHPEATRTAPRYLPGSGSVGEGLMMALDAGAATSQGMNTFYGHLVYMRPDGLRPDLTGMAPSGLTTKWDVQCAVVNVRGERFTDESDASECIGQDALKQPESEFPRGRAFVIFDAPIYAEHKVEIEDAVKRGAVIISADTIEALAEKMNAWGVYPQGVVATMKEFNEAMANGTTGKLRVPKSVQREAGYVWKLPLLNKITTAPFYCIPAAPGLTFTEGGVQVGLKCEVLDHDQKPIPGLFAAGETAGGLICRQYVAGSGIAKTFLQGFLAGDSAAKAKA